MRALTYSRPSLPFIKWPRALKPLVGLKISYHAKGSLIPVISMVDEVKKGNILLATGEWIHTSTHNLEKIHNNPV